MKKILLSILTAIMAWSAAWGVRENGGRWLDTNGGLINAHGGGVMYHDGKYWWYGEHRPDKGGSTQVGVTCYSSPNLEDWTFEGVALPVVEDDPMGVEPGCIVERPKVIYNPKTGKFVMWFHHELKGKGYAAAQAGVAVADNPQGPFRMVRSSRVNASKLPANIPDVKKKPVFDEKMEWWTPSWYEDVNNGMFVYRDLPGGQMSRDMTLFVDDDGKAYHVYSSEENLTLQIAELDDTYTRHTGKYIRIFPGGHNEAPAIFKKDGKYWMIASGCTGWDPNEARLMQADSMMGEWKRLPNPCIGPDAEKTFLGQSAYVLRTPDDRYIAIFDRWNPKSLSDSRYLWLPISFNAEGVPEVRWSDTFTGNEASATRQIIARVNNYWQENNPAEVNPFWDNAAYHTGNMEAYRLTGNDAWLDYSQRWAEHNEWKGAKSDDRSKWKYNYGETDEHVLFGDWQICFQTYADLYNLLPDDRRIKRAREVMEYEMSTPANDYWWWADGLYMVMPVMTKLYKITDNPQYLDKLYEYITFSDSIMFDPEENLYYRDAKYTYPKHKSANGKKDFWARGDGWVLAGLAKVLQDLPASYAHRPFFEERFRKMADAVVACQQPGGYWSRSMYDEAHAPGPETSGTAFFTYGLLWGLNNGYLSGEKYLDAAKKGWNYLKTTALQESGKVGYVQPIGEKAIPGQVVDANSTSNFGVGAFLLAACEYVRMLEGGTTNDRDYWVRLLTRMASPVLDNMSKGELQKNMLVEVSPNWDGRDKGVTYMETFGRLMAGIAPWLSLPDDDTAEGKLRKELRDKALASYRNAVDPKSPDYLLWRGHGQALVDAAYVAESFLRGYDALWLPLDDVTKQRYIEEFTQLRRVDPPYTNWLLFSSTIESFLAKAGAECDEYRVNSAIRKTEEWYVGDGWYADGPSFAYDYYSSYVFHPMLLETLQSMRDAGRYTRIHYQKYYDRAIKRTQKFAIVLERMISPEGTFPVFGRSIPYRMATLQPLAMMAWYEKLPAGLTNGQVRSALTAVMHRMFDGKENFNEGGFLTIGFAGRQPNIADWYTNNGSLYMTSLSFLPLGLPATHPFWTDAALPWTNQKAWGGDPFPKDHHWADGQQIHDLF